MSASLFDIRLVRSIPDAVRASELDFVLSASEAAEAVRNVVLTCTGKALDEDLLIRGPDGATYARDGLYVSAHLA